MRKYDISQTVLRNLILKHLKALSLGTEHRELLFKAIYFDCYVYFHPL